MPASTRSAIVSLGRSPGFNWSQGSGSGCRHLNPAKSPQAANGSLPGKLPLQPLSTAPPNELLANDDFAAILAGPANRLTSVHVSLEWWFQVLNATLETLVISGDFRAAIMAVRAFQTETDSTSQRHSANPTSKVSHLELETAESWT